MKQQRIAVELLDDRPRFGSIVKMKTQYLFLDIYYHERRVRLSSGLTDTPENRQQLCRLLNRIGELIEQRTFNFAETFPRASNKLKRFFGEKEKRTIHPEPQYVLFGEYAKKWMEINLPKFSHSKQVDYTQMLTYWLIPRLGKLAFSELTGPFLREFVETLKQKDGKHKGKSLSAHRKRNIMTPLKKIWEDACDRYNWNLRDPFKAAKDEITTSAQHEEKKEREIFLFSEWLAFLACMEPFYLPVTELQILTGLIASELRGLRKEDVTDSFLYVRNSISRGVEKKGGKNQYRKREIPMTKAIKRCLDAAMAISPNEYVFSMPDGERVSFSTYRNVWDRALKAAGLTNKTPYSTRHSLVQWSLVAGMTPVRLVEIMGHRDKQMIFNTYGRYRHGLVEDRRAIIEYLGKDYLAPENAAALEPHSETYSETQGPETANYLKVVGI